MEEYHSYSQLQHRWDKVWWRWHLDRFLIYHWDLVPRNEHAMLEFTNAKIYDSWIQHNNENKQFFFFLNGKQNFILEMP